MSMDWPEKTREKYAHIPILPLEQLVELPGPEEYDSGIYFLWAGKALVYIGKSKNLCNRLYYQRTLNRAEPFQVGTKAKAIPFDRMTCLVLENGIVCSPQLEANLQAYERAYLAAYEPIYNQDYQDGVT